jgi:hypothetical protein
MCVICVSTPSPCCVWDFPTQKMRLRDYDDAGPGRRHLRGYSTGGNVAVAPRVAKRLGSEHTVVTVAVDSGVKYLSTAPYSGGAATES